MTRTTSERDLRRIIREAGFRPVKRDTLYRTYFLDEEGDSSDFSGENLIPPQSSELTVWTTS